MGGFQNFFFLLKHSALSQVEHIDDKRSPIRFIAHGKARQTLTYSGLNICSLRNQSVLTQSSKARK